MIRNKKFLTGFLSIMLVLALLLSGCSEPVTVAPNITLSAADIGEDASLSVYIFTGGAIKHKCLDDVKAFAADYETMIDVTIKEYTDAEEMKTTLEEELAAGKGPDVIVGNSAFGMDMLLTAKTGAFYDLTDIIAADASFNDETYYTSVMTAGQLNDRQYVVPLSFTLPAFVSTTSNLQAMGIDLTTDSTLDVYEKMLAYLKASDEPQVSGYGYGYNGNFDTTMALMQSLGKTPVSYETGEVNLDGEEEKLLLEFGAYLYDHTNDWATKNLRNPTFEIATTEVPLVYAKAYTSPIQLQVYYSSYAHQWKGEEVELFFAPDANGNHHALVQEFGAVNANAKDPQLAWKFLQILMGRQEERNVYTSLSLKRDVTKTAIQEITTHSEHINGEFWNQQMPQKYADQMLAACDTITDAVLNQETLLTAIFKDSANAYVRGSYDFDAMLENIKSRVEQYIND